MRLHTRILATIILIAVMSPALSLARPLTPKIIIHSANCVWQNPIIHKDRVEIVADNSGGVAKYLYYSTNPNGPWQSNGIAPSIDPKTGNQYWLVPTIPNACYYIILATGSHASALGSYGGDSNGNAYKLCPCSVIEAPGAAKPFHK